MGRNSQHLSQEELRVNANLLRCCKPVSQHKENIFNIFETDICSYSWPFSKSQHGISNRMNASVASDSFSAVTKNKMDALSALIAENAEVTQELSKCKIINCALKNVIQKDIPGNPRLTEKLKLMVGTEDAIGLCQNMPLLGLEMENFTECLSAAEKNEIKHFLENEIKKECQKILRYDLREEYGRVQSVQQAGGKVIPVELPETVTERMNCKLHKWNELLLKMKSLISDLLDLRQKARSFRDEEKCWLSVKCEALELEAKTLALRIQTQIYSENSYVVPATMKASLSIEGEYNNMLKELEELKKKKEAYDRLKDTEYDDVLEEYLLLKKEIDIKSWALNKLDGV